MSKEYCLPIRLQRRPNIGFHSLQFVVHLATIGLSFYSLPPMLAGLLFIPVFISLLQLAITLVGLHRNNIVAFEVDLDEHWCMLDDNGRKLRVKLISKVVMGHVGFLLFEHKRLRYRIMVSKNTEQSSQWHRFRVYCLSPSKEE